MTSRRLGWPFWWTAGGLIRSVLQRLIQILLETFLYYFSLESVGCDLAASKQANAIRMWFPIRIRFSLGEN